MSTPTHEPPVDGKELAARNLSKIAFLLERPEFQWFLEQCVEQKRAEADRDLHELKRTKEERENDLHRWTVLDEVRRWPGEQRAMYQRTLGAC